MKGGRGGREGGRGEGEMKKSYTVYTNANLIN